MATKSVTLKDSNGDTLYPVTDSNVVNINQQKTLAQALDGVIYAEDPTAAATASPWVTSSDIDWSTMPFNYSTTEVDTGFTWIDGKHIYKKTINTGQLPSYGNISSTDISALNIDTVVDYGGVAWSNAGNVRKLPFVSVDLDNIIRVDIQSRNTLRIVSHASGDWNNYSNSYVTIWYTKSS